MLSCPVIYAGSTALVPGAVAPMPPCPSSLTAAWAMIRPSLISHPRHQESPLTPISVPLFPPTSTTAHAARARLLAFLDAPLAPFGVHRMRASLGHSSSHGHDADAERPPHAMLLLLEVRLSVDGVGVNPVYHWKYMLYTFPQPPAFLTVPHFHFDLAPSRSLRCAS
ncbi:hypothetical protein B0H13DRAFT_2366723 [Mycena leptocephala]|nr:hypothetical protein B0H13DRAFT_2366723 [Mycena leptocephala]